MGRGLDSIMRGGSHKGAVWIPLDYSNRVPPQNTDRRDGTFHVPRVRPPTWNGRRSRSMSGKSSRMTPLHFADVHRELGRLPSRLPLAMFRGRVAEGIWGAWSKLHMVRG